MSTFNFCTRYIDERRLRAALVAKGLMPGSRKWMEVRFRIQHRFYKD